jgi:hypothetical protein
MIHQLLRNLTGARLILLLLEYALSLARDLAHSWPRGPHQYYLCATPPSKLLMQLSAARSRQRGGKMVAAEQWDAL